MKKNNLESKVPGMKLAKFVREFAKLNAWNMTKAMNRKSVQSYLNFEREAKRVTLADFYLLEEIYVKKGGTKRDFEAMARKCAVEEAETE